MKFPLIIKRGAATVKIYRTPDSQKKDSSRKPVRYDAYTLTYTFGGKRIRKKFGDLNKARTEAELAAVAVANGAMASLQLTPGQIRDYCSAVENLKVTGIDLPSAITEYVEAKRTVGSSHLVQAAQFFSRYAGDKIVATPVPDLVTALIQEKRDEGAGSYHINDLVTRLAKFKEAFPGFIADITTPEINAWLKKLKLEPRTQNNYRAVVVQLFNYAKTKAKALPHWLPHSADSSIRVKEPNKDTEIYTPAEMQKIMDGVPADLRTCISLRAFSGIRNEELFKLSWHEVDLATGWIKLKHATTKLRARRIIPILPNLRTWISDKALTKGKVQPGYASAKTLSEALSHAIKDSGVPMKRNALRNCYTSYRLATLGDIAKVAEETGNSPQVIREEYLELVTPEQAKEWFSISAKV